VITLDRITYHRDTVHCQTQTAFGGGGIVGREKGQYRYKREQNARKISARKTDSQKRESSGREGEGGRGEGREIKNDTASNKTALGWLLPRC
jgi:hypothetical protein